MRKPTTFLGKPRKFKDLCLVYPPTVNDVIDNEFELFYSILTVTQEELDDEYSKQDNESGYIPTPFEYVLLNSYASEDFNLRAKQAFKFFIHEDVSIMPEAECILIGNIEEEIQKVGSLDDLKLLKQEDFFDFQNAIRECCGREEYESPEDLSKLHPKIRAMKAKARYRDKIKAQQEAKNAPTLEVMLASICCMGIGLTPLNIGEISYASVGKLIEANQKKENYQLDCNALLVGADPKKVKYWIRNT